MTRFNALQRGNMLRSQVFAAPIAAMLLMTAESLPAQPIPEFFGVYVVSDGKLVELRPLEGSQYRNMALAGGRDILKGSSGITVTDTNVSFVVYREGASESPKLFLEGMKRVRYNVSGDEFSVGARTKVEEIQDGWVATGLGYNLRVGPLGGNPSMMVRAVPEGRILPGRYALNIGSALYDLQIGPDTESCVVRQAAFASGAVYTDCEEFFAKNPKLLPRGSSGSRKSPAKTQAVPLIDPSQPKPVVVLETTLGVIELELDPATAPITVANFLEYVKAGHYDGTVFHRVIPGFMIQGGGMDADLREKPTRATIKNEADNGLKNKRGTIAMARKPDPDSASGQFFINVADNAALDHRDKSAQGYGYAVFGKVIAGMDVADKIVSVRTGRRGPFSDVPVEPVTIRKASVK